MSRILMSAMLTAGIVLDGESYIDGCVQRIASSVG